MLNHVILEGKPTTGKTEVSNLLKIFFPGRVHILPELTTVLVRENGLNILRDRSKLTALLKDAVPARAEEVRQLVAKDHSLLVLEESHMGVHWAYSKVIGDTEFLELYEEEIQYSILIPDRFVRLDIPIGLSVKRQIARGTPDVEVSGELVTKMFEYLQQWHDNLGENNLSVLNTNRSPDLVFAELLQLLELEYEVF
ncbi:MAG: hypothetical protein RBU37_17785 [Myxococcota bacterium]|nr:hypothetical protein [Myxococcota bacterium]